MEAQTYLLNDPLYPIPQHLHQPILHPIRHLIRHVQPIPGRVLRDCAELQGMYVIVQRDEERQMVRRGVGGRWLGEGKRYEDRLKVEVDGDGVYR
jgi:hypothetical protein